MHVICINKSSKQKRVNSFLFIYIKLTSIYNNNNDNNNNNNNNNKFIGAHLVNPIMRLHYD